MLSLSRKKNESIIIGENIVVRVLDVSPSGTVKLGIQAPPEVSIDREEIRAAKDADLAKRKEGV